MLKNRCVVSMFKMYTPAARSAMFIEPFTKEAPVFFPNTSKRESTLYINVEEGTAMFNTSVAGLG